MIDAADTSRRCAECGVLGAQRRIDQARVALLGCGPTDNAGIDNADINATHNIFRARILAGKHPTRTLRRVRKKQCLEEVAHAA